MRIQFFVLALFVCAEIALAGHDNLQITLRSGDKLTQVSFVLVDKDYLSISTHGLATNIFIDSIVEIRQIGHSKSLLVAGIGLLGGGLVGAMVGAGAAPGVGLNKIDDVQNGALIGGLAGFLFGAVVGASSGGDEIFDLSASNKETKIAIVHHLLSELSGVKH